MGWALATRIGLRDSWRILRILGDSRSLIGEEGDSAAARRGVNRADFLRSSALGGALAFASLATPGLIKSAWGAGQSADVMAFRTLGHVVLPSAQRAEAFARVGGRPEVVQILAELRVAQAALVGDAVHSALHRLPGGKSVQVTVLAPPSAPDHLVEVKEFREPHEGLMYETCLWRMTERETLVLEGISFNGTEMQLPSQDKDPRACGQCGLGNLQAGAACKEIHWKSCATCVSCASCINAKNPAGRAACGACLVSCGQSAPDCCVGTITVCRPCGAKA